MDSRNFYQFTCPVNKTCGALYVIINKVNSMFLIISSYISKLCFRCFNAKTSYIFNLYFQYFSGEIERESVFNLREFMFVCIQVYFRCKYLSTSTSQKKYYIMILMLSFLYIEPGFSIFKWRESVSVCA